MNKNLICIGAVFLVVSVGIFIILNIGGFDLNTLNPPYRMMPTILLSLMGSIGLIVLLIGSVIGEGFPKGIPVSITERNTTKPSNDAMNILNIRYAKGEITEEEFEKMKKKLEG